MLRRGGSSPSRRTKSYSALVMELVYVPDSKSGFWGFESLLGHQKVWMGGRVWFIALVLKTSVPERVPWVRILPHPPLCLGVAQPGSASGLGPEGREFEPLHRDHYGE